MDEKLKLISKYNIWNGNEIDCGFKRLSYLKKIMSVSGNRLVKVLTGQRRTGKSYILRQILMNLVNNGTDRHNTLYVSKEYVNFDFLRDYADLESLYRLYLEEFKPKGRIYLFLDEIQNIIGWERFVNSHSQDFTEECEIFVTGSNSRMLSTELATLLSGRYVEIPIFTFGYNEYLNIVNQGIGRESYRQYLMLGGLPELMNFKSDEGRNYYVASVKDTIILRDIIQRRQNIRDAQLLDDLFKYLICNASNPISIQNIVKYYKGRQRIVAYETIANYIKYITESYLLHPVMQYNIKGKSVAESPYKYYANDLSYKNYLYSGIGYGLGYMLENTVYLELRRFGYTVYAGELRNKEIDFVAVKDDRKIYIQTSLSIEDDTTRIREYESLMAISDNYEKWVVTLDDIQMPTIEGIRHIQAWNLQTILG